MRITVITMWVVLAVSAAAQQAPINPRQQRGASVHIFAPDQHERHHFERTEHRSDRTHRDRRPAEVKVVEGARDSAEQEEDERGHDQPHPNPPVVDRAQPAVHPRRGTVQPVQPFRNRAVAKNITAIRSGGAVCFQLT